MSTKAINILKKHLVELDSISNAKQGNTWKASLKDTLALYIGADSSILKRLDELVFTRQNSHVSRDIGSFSTYVFDEGKKENFHDLINNAIKYIQNNGIYKSNSNNNFLGNFNNTEIISGFVTALTLACAFAFFLGTVKYDAEKIALSEGKKSLLDTISVREDAIKFMRHNSDSALNILGNIPYKEMKLDTLSFRKVQTTIEKAGAVLYLNINFGK